MNSIKSLVRGAYDIQKLRIQIGNRIVANFKAKLGQEPGVKEDELDFEGKRILNNMRMTYNKITDGVKNFMPRSKFTSDEIISDYTEFCLVAQYLELEKDEDRHFKRLEAVLEDYPVYVNFLNPIKGIGPTLAGVIIAEIDIAKAKYASSLWRYAGLDVAEDGRGRSRRKEHLIKKAYTNAAGEECERDSITFSPFLKTKLIGVLGTSFLRTGDNKYSLIYRNYKHRLENHVVHQDKTKAHRHNMAIRYMIKLFLVDLYIAWRTLENLPVYDTYAETKLGLRHEQAA